MALFKFKELFVLAIVCLLPLLIHAQDKPPQKELVLKEIVKAEAPLSQRIFFIIDVSGSMSGADRINKAVRFVKNIWQSPVDEFEIAVIVFNDTFTRWKGVPCPPDDPKPCPEGWAKLPSKEAIDSAQLFLDGYPGTGSTRVMPALEMAFKEDRKNLSMILITDGEFDEPSDYVLNKIKEMQKTRQEKGLGEFVISVFGVGNVELQDNLKTIGRVHGGGFYIEKQKTPPALPPKPMVVPSPF